MKNKTKIIFVLIFFSLLNINLLYAEDSSNEQRSADKIIQGLKQGNIQGEIGLYYEFIDYDKRSFIDEDEIFQLSDSHLLVPYLQIDYQSPDYKNFSFGVGFTGYIHIVKDEEDGSIFRDLDRLITHQLYIQYELSETIFKLGRMELEDTIFLTDYYKAFSIFSKEIDTVHFFFAVVEEVADSDISQFIEFENIDRGNETIDDYLLAVEAAWDIFPDFLSTTLYYYYQGHLYHLYGMHSEFSHGFNDVSLGLDFDYYATDEDSTNGMRNINDEVDDTDVYHISPYIEYKDFSLAAGYIEAHPQVGAREDVIIDDYFNPLNEGDKVYEPDAKTWYAALEYDREDYNIEIIYGDTEYLDGSQHLTEKEFAINASLTFKEKFEFDVLFSRINSESPEGNYTTFEMALTYEL